MYQENNLNLRIFAGEPIPLYWGGWHSSTHELDRQGWTFDASTSTDEYLNRLCIRLAATSPEKGVVISGVFYIAPREIAMRGSYHDIGSMWRGEFYDSPMRMQQYSCKEVFRSVSMPELQSWELLEKVDIHKAVDVRPRELFRRMDQFRFFAPLENTHNEIYVPEESVDELLNKILKVQFPKQQEIKKSLILPESKPIIQAKVFSLAI